jgi:hypothetical protein
MHFTIATKGCKRWKDRVGNGHTVLNTLCDYYIYFFCVRVYIVKGTLGVEDIMGGTDTCLQATTADMVDRTTTFSVPRAFLYEPGAGQLPET